MPKKSNEQRQPNPGCWGYLKRWLIRAAVLLLVVFCGRGVLYRGLVQYREIQQRPAIRIEHPGIRRDLDDWSREHEQATTELIVDFALHYATDSIGYTFGRCSTNPNQIVDTHSTNCIGYSALFHAVVLYLLNRKGLAASVKAEHKVAHLYVLGCNIHPWLDDPAFKDHDYNVVTDSNVHRKYVVDPTVFGAFGINRVVEQE